MCSPLRLSAAFLTCILLKVAVGAAVSSEGTSSVQSTASVPLKIKIPDSTEVVDTDVAVNSLIPECVKKDPGTVQECAKQELSRVHDELEKPAQSRPSGLRGNKAEKAAEPHDLTPGHERVNHDILAQHGVKDKDTKEKVTSDGTGNGTTDAVKAAANSNEMLSVLQTVFDYKRVINDLRRILRGDVFGVLGEYPGRMNGLFKMVQELPRRIVKSIGIVNRLRTDTNDTTFRGLLTNLRDYLNQASQNAKNLPDAFNMISVIETLRNVAAKIGDAVYRRSEEVPAQRAILASVEEILDLAFPTAALSAKEHRGGILSRAISFPERFISDTVHHRSLFHLRPQPASGRSPQQG